MKTQFFKNYFKNFQSRKFEKIFKTFLSPLNKEDLSSSVLLDYKSKKLNFPERINAYFSLNQKQNLKKPINSKIFSKFKRSKDSIVLETLSTSVKQKLMNSDFLVYISYDQIKQNKKRNLQLQRE